MRVEWVVDGVHHVSDDGKMPRKKKSSHVQDETDAKPWLVYRVGKGYFWGPGHTRAGDPAHFGVDV